MPAARCASLPTKRIFLDTLDAEGAAKALMIIGCAALRGTALDETRGHEEALGEKTAELRAAVRNVLVLRCGAEAEPEDRESFEQVL